MRKLLPIILSLFYLPLFAGVEVEYALLVDEDVPDVMLQFLPQRIFIGIHEKGVIVRGEYMGGRATDYDLHPAGDAFWYQCRGKDEAIQQPFTGATDIIYTDDPPVTIADLPCKRAIAIVDGDSIDIYYTDIFGVDFCQIAAIRGFAMYYSKTVNGLEVTYQAVRFKPGNFPPAMFDLSTRRITPYKPPKEDRYNARSKFFIGKPAPAITGRTLSGKTIDAEYLQGKVVALNFWFTTCPPCRQEIPALNVLAARHAIREDVVFIGIALDDENRLARFLENTPFIYNIIPSGSTAASRHRVNAYPTNIVIDRQGNIAEYIVGFAEDIDQRLDAAIRKALQKK